MHGCSYSLHTSSYDSAARSHVRFFEFLHQLEWDFLLMEEFLNHAVPGLVEGFIQVNTVSEVPVVPWSVLPS